MRLEVIVGRLKDNIRGFVEKDEATLHGPGLLPGDTAGRSPTGPKVHGQQEGFFSL